jgi:hypothetical protein
MYIYKQIQLPLFDKKQYYVLYHTDRVIIKRYGMQSIPVRTFYDKNKTKQQPKKKTSVKKQ